MIRKMIGYSKITKYGSMQNQMKTSQYIQIFGMYLFTMITETWQSKVPGIYDLKTLKRTGHLWTHPIYWLQLRETCL